MAFKIGFSVETEKKLENEFIPGASKRTTPKKSVVRVFFPQKNTTLSYYNELFDLRAGDLVYVDGKLEGLQGRVIEISYNFKIKLSDYKRVIALVDTDVSGEFYIGGSHCVSFDRKTLPYEKAFLWFKAPGKDDDAIKIIGKDSPNLSAILEELEKERGDEEFPTDILTYKIEREAWEKKYGWK